MCITPLGLFFDCLSLSFVIIFFASPVSTTVMCSQNVIGQCKVGSGKVVLTQITL